MKRWTDSATQWDGFQRLSRKFVVAKALRCISSKGAREETCQQVQKNKETYFILPEACCYGRVAGVVMAWFLPLSLPLSLLLLLSSVHPSMHLCGQNSPTNDCHMFFTNGPVPGDVFLLYQRVRLTASGYTQAALLQKCLE